MAESDYATQELARLLGVLAHPERIKIVEELRNGELDVCTIQQLLGVAQSRVSQNLSVLRSARIVAERRCGRHVYYRLVQKAMASWLLEGIRFLENEAAMSREFCASLGRTREMWSEPAPDSPPASAPAPVSGPQE